MGGKPGFSGSSEHGVAGAEAVCSANRCSQAYVKTQTCSSRQGGTWRNVDCSLGLPVGPISRVWCPPSKALRFQPLELESRIPLSLSHLFLLFFFFFVFCLFLPISKQAPPLGKNVTSSFYGRTGTKNSAPK